MVRIWGKFQALPESVMLRGPQVLDSLILDPSSNLFHPCGHSYVSVCPSGPVPKGKGV